jgi:hypothetical protein
VCIVQNEFTVEVENIKLNMFHGRYCRLLIASVFNSYFFSYHPTVNRNLTSSQGTNILNIGWGWQIRERTGG